MEAAPKARRRRAVARRRLAALLFIAAVVVTLGLVRLSCRDEQPPFTGRLSEPGGGRAYRVTAWNTRQPRLDRRRAEGQGDRRGGLRLVPLPARRRRRRRERGPRPGAVDPAGRRAGLRDRCESRARAAASAARSRSAILATQESRAAHVETLVQLVLDKGYDGLDLDWELVRVADRDRFSAFVEDLAAALHEEHRLISIAVFAKESEPGTWPTQKAEDYARLGAAVDEFKVMTYSYSGGWSDPGPQTPLDWAGRALAFAASQVPPREGPHGRALLRLRLARRGDHRDALARRRRQARGARRKAASRHEASQEATFTYEEEGVTHTVFFQDRKAIAAKLDLLAAEARQARRHRHLADVRRGPGLLGRHPQAIELITVGGRASRWDRVTP